MKTALFHTAAILLVAISVPADEASAGPRARRILYNLDGDSCMTLKAGRSGPGPITAVDLTNLVAELTQSGSQVDTLLLCVNAQVTYYPTKVGTLRGTLSTPEERSKWPAHEQQRFTNMQAFFGTGLDPYAVILAEARRRGLEALLTFRVNDAHGNDFLRTAFWRDHPELRLGNGALDFAHDAVRDYVFRLLEEAVQRYDCDGLELDFQRFPTFFGAGGVEENTARINGLVERVRRLLNAESAKRGKRLVLAARAPSDYGQAKPTYEQSRSPTKACDPAEWARRGWIDFLTVSEFLFTAETLDLKSWRQHVSGVPIYAAIQPETKPSTNPRRCEFGLGADGYRKYARERWADGADGIYLFNFFTTREWSEPTEPPFEVLARIGDPKTLSTPDPGSNPADNRVGQPADISGSAYAYRADRPADANPPESWVLLMQYAGLPYDKPVDVKAPAIRQVLCGLLWEEVRPVRRIELSWPADAKRRPSPEHLAVTCFDATDNTAHTWWNPRTLKEAGPPQVSADGRLYTYSIPMDTWGVVATVRGEPEAANFSVPTIRARVPDVWKKIKLEIEWGFDDATAALEYDGRVEAYDGVIGELTPLTGDTGTTRTGAQAWRSIRRSDGRRGVQLSTLYMGTSRWRRVWPYHAQPEDVARTILTVWTRSGSFSFQVSDLEQGPILAPESGFFVRAIEIQGEVQTPSPPAASEPPFSLASNARSAKEFLAELSARGHKTIRQRVREHPEQTWADAVAAMQPGVALPAHPEPEFEPAMQVEVPDARLTAQWKLGAWHILRRSVKGEDGHWRFNDYPFGILASETYMILRTLDLQGLHREAADGLDQWLRLPLEPKVVPGAGGHHGWALPDRPLGHFGDGTGCLTHAEGIPGVGGHMDGVHGMGPGAIMFTLTEHFRLTGDLDWLKAHASRMKANADWILRQRRLLTANLPGGHRVWSKGLQPAHVVTPDSERMHMQFYESEAYYWLAVKRMAELLTLIDPSEGARMAAEAEAYRRDLLAAIDRSITLTPVVPVRDGTYRSFIPFSPYVRGFAAGAWGWRRCQGHVGAIYWDTVQSADPLISPSGLLSPRDRRVQGHLDVLEDRLLLENTKVNERTAGFDPEKHWFSRASWQYQCGLERHANIHLAADDVPNFLRSLLNQYAVDIMPGEYTFREHTTGGPPDKIYEEACFLERFRQMLVMEEGDALWLARATPRAWLAHGQKIRVKNAPTHFGVVGYEIGSDVDHGRIAAVLELPSRQPLPVVFLRLRHPTAAPIRSVMVNGQAWSQFNSKKEVIELRELTGNVAVTASY